MFFKDQIKKRIKNEKGLTLIELLAVIVILAIVAAIAIPAIGSIIDNSRVKAIKADAANIVSAAKIWHADGNTGNFTIAVGGTHDQVDLGSSEVTGEITVTGDGKISGALTRGNKVLTMNAVSLTDLGVDTTDLGATGTPAAGEYSIK